MPSVSSTVRTVLGSSINGTNRFFGYMREFRIWNTARSMGDLSTYRFSSNIEIFKSSDQSNYNPNLLHYFRMDSGIYSNRIIDIASGGMNSFSEKSQSLSSFTYVLD